MIGLEVESVEDKAKLLAPFTIARVISAEQHPNADRLRVCMVDTGAGEPVQVVCGAPNARTGMKGVFVPPGAYIPGKNITLAVGTIRGVESRGMLVSGRRAASSPTTTTASSICRPMRRSARPTRKWAGLDDPVIEIKLTPNRPDCTGVHGIARDLAAADIGTFKDTADQAGDGHIPLPGHGDARFRRDAVALPGFALRLVRGVKNGPSPGLAAAAAHRDRAAPDQRAGRHHQLHHLRPRPAAARVRRRQGARQSHGAPRARRRDSCSRSTARPTRSTTRCA